MVVDEKKVWFKIQAQNDIAKIDFIVDRSDLCLTYREH